MLDDPEIRRRHMERVRSRKRWPIVKPKPRTLSVAFGRERAYTGRPDVVFARGEGCEKSDAAWLYSVFAVLDTNAEYRKISAERAKLPHRSILDELSARGYDITTLRFEIQKFPEETEKPAKAEPVLDYEI